jgi:hypothetical protein
MHAHLLRCGGGMCAVVITRRNINIEQTQSMLIACLRAWSSNGSTWLMWCGGACVHEYFGVCT